MNRELKNKVKINTAVFLWILLCNLIVQVFLTEIESIGFCNWAFFLINILFFLMTDVDYKERFVRVLAGSLFGLLAAGMLIYTAGLLGSAGMSSLISLMIPLAVCLAVIIILHPVYPRVFNNCAFAYFLVSLIDAEAAFTEMTSYMCSAAAGHFIVNIGTVLVIMMMTRRIEKKGKNEF